MVRVAFPLGTFSKMAVPSGSVMEKMPCSVSRQAAPTRGSPSASEYTFNCKLTGFLEFCAEREGAAVTINININTNPSTST